MKVHALLHQQLLHTGLLLLSHSSSTGNINTSYVFKPVSYISVKYLIRSHVGSHKYRCYTAFQLAENNFTFD